MRIRKNYISKELKRLIATFGLFCLISAVSAQPIFKMSTTANGDNYFFSILSGEWRVDTTFIGGYGSCKPIFVLGKFDSTGTLLWHREMHDQSIFGDRYDYTGMDMDENKNIYITSTFYNSMELDSANKIESNPRFIANLYIAKFDSTGNFVWVRTIKSQSEGVDLDYNENSEITMIGKFVGDSLTIDSLPFVSSGSSSRGSFVANLDTTGKALWLKVLVADGNNSFELHDITSDSAGNKFLLGEISGASYFEYVQKIYSTAGHGYSNVILKLDNNGKLVWFQFIDNRYSNVWETPEILLDKSQTNLYVTGTFRDSITCGNLPSIASEGKDFDKYIVKYDTSGIAKWLRTANSNSKQYNYKGNLSINIDEFGRLFFGGNFIGTAQFLPLPELNADYNAGYIVRYDSNGSALCSDTTLSSMRDITSDNFGSFYTFSGEPERYSWNSTDTSFLFLKKWDGNCNLIWSKKMLKRVECHTGIENPPSSTSLKIIPNPNSGIFNVQLPHKITNGILNIYNIRGQVIYQRNIPNSNSLLIESIDLGRKSGLFFVTFEGNNERMRSKVILY